MKYRKEKDSLGTIEVPVNAYFGASTRERLTIFLSAILDFTRHLFIHLL